ncbi:CbtB-domain containing protein [Streptomyces sp. TRM68367]|uniref:CbtB-domain containing protein n=1 Tax=Streptomyces sp. TRM68367 TaxID=2758415 RepID=UPI00165B2606|nr:CbtB-domain containing protein [Streptomyces sp. TRM68367]MBC9723841.1 CbtB-domain containing protein [Streptomyces sp. TRM68367]
MSASAIPEARPATGLVVHPLRDGLIAAAAVILALVALDAVFLDQGALLSPVLGKVATSANYVHEFAHDGRHLLAGPCH